MKIIKPIHHLILLMITSCFISACGTVPIKSPAELAIDHGYVTGSIQTKEVIGLHLRSTQGDTAYVYSGEQSFVDRALGAWVPEGSYRITHLATKGVVNQNLIAVGDKSLPLISVKAGEITDLNRLLPFNLGGSKYALVSLEGKDTTSKLLEEFPELFDTPTPIEWQASGSIPVGKISSGSTGHGLIIDAMLAFGDSKQRGEELELNGLTHENAFKVLRQFSQANTKLVVGSDGTGYFGTHTGQIRYKKDGEWRVLDTGTLEAINAIELREDSLAAILFETGDLILLDENRKPSFEKLSFSQGEIPIDVRSLNGKRYVSSVITPASSELSESGPVSMPIVRVYEQHGSEIRLVSELAGTTKTNAYFQIKPVISASGNILIVALPPGDSWTLNTATGQTTKLDTPHKFSGASHNVNENLLTLWLASGMFSKASTTNDLGSTWQNLPKPPYQPQDIYLNNMESGYMWSVSIGMVTSSFKLEKFNKKVKDDWEDVTKTEVSCQQILSNYSKNEHYCMFPNATMKTFANNRWRN